MSTVLNIEHLIIPNDVIVSLASIYRYIGQNSFFTETVRGDLNRVVDQTIQRDAFFLARILKLNISDTRTRLIITKDSKPRTKEETTLSNIKKALEKIQYNYKAYRHQSNDLLDLANFLYSHYHEVKFVLMPSERKSVLKSQASRSKRLVLDEINTVIETAIEKQSFDIITLCLNFFIDFYNIAPLTNHNETIALFLLYLLLLKADLEAFRFISFFEILVEHYKEFETEVKHASINWKEGLAQTMGFVRFMLNIILKGYQKAHEVIKDYKFDINLNKGYNIENTINKLPEIFSKDEIRLIHPYVSESTINRALIKMRDEGQIKPLGKGRSAKWIRIIKD